MDPPRTQKDPIRRTLNSLQRFPISSKQSRSVLPFGRFPRFEWERGRDEHRLSCATFRLDIERYHSNVRRYTDRLA